MARPICDLLKVLADHAAERGSSALAREAMEAAAGPQIIQIQDIESLIVGLDNQGRLWSLDDNNEEEIEVAGATYNPVHRWNLWMVGNHDLANEDMT